jgi:intracellular sulfur oxidation DsrE/DsrF family protein
MRKHFNRTLLFTCFVTISFALAAQPSTDKKFQTQTEMALPVKNYGKVYHVPFATDRPDPNMPYKIVYEASGEELDSSHIYPPLEYAARMYNLHVYGGVPQKNLDVVLVIGGLGIPAVMNNEAYRKRYGVDNPNLKILAELKAAGIKINGCAQAMMKNLIDPAEVNPEVSIIFSRFTTVATYQLKGYAYFKF